LIRPHDRHVTVATIQNPGTWLWGESERMVFDFSELDKH
jgi:hypothetical protein